MTKEKATRVLDALETLYPNARAELNFHNPFETLIATILSAQCTDRRVNMVTERLFARYPDAQSLALVPQEELEAQIRECGLYRMKAKNIRAACQALVAEYGGQVPSTREALMKLPGVGQKTAGVVLLAAFGGDEIPVDTHVRRVSNRIGLAHAEAPEKVEEQLRAILPQERWSHAHHLLIWHGRRICAARAPHCEKCPLADGLCENREK
ncbi:MAG TPA: endonuclease III [Candidatus Alectryocaccomicrobium excrementavium]|uniref:Endonuclease III n=1 Tax=Candidatus Alectryocaccomicrobium excrementavium TaxID=2840668 RepID=A0A9D1FZ06_9FIRM|nr:endonuclease III [Candidatus Alectryocaccomicrobium excrementavium]